MPTGELFAGRYRLSHLLGAGGYSEVFRAVQLSTDQWVAIKVMKFSPDCAPAERERAVGRFKREVSLVANVRHPNVVRIIDAGETDDDQLYSVFEYVPGVTLETWLRDRGRLSPSLAFHLMSQVADALAASHRAGVVHRDLKPQNIMICESGARANVVVLDFGVGAFVAPSVFVDTKRLTKAEHWVGTPHYAAPEQIRGQPPVAASDIYAWGLVFIECLTGRRLIDDDDSDVVVRRQYQMTDEPLPAWLAAHPLGDIIGRAVRKDLKERTARAVDLVRALDAVDRHAVATLVPPPAPEDDIDLPELTTDEQLR